MNLVTIRRHLPFLENYSVSDLDKNSIDYWLSSWINYYRQALKMQDPQTLFLNYSTYCNSPNKVLELISKKTSLQVDLPQIEPFKNRRKVNHQASTALIQEAVKLYAHLVMRNLQPLLSAENLLCTLLGQVRSTRYF